MSCQSLRGQRAAGDVAHLRAVVVADPHAADIMRGVADEPGVARALLVPVLPPAIWSGSAACLAGAADHGRVHHVVHFARHRASATTWPMVELLPLVEHLAVAVAHAGDDMRGDAFAAIGERRVGAGRARAGVTSAVPSAIEGLVVQLASGCRAAAPCAPRCRGPTSAASFAATVLIDWAKRRGG